MKILDKEYEEISCSEVENKELKREDLENLFEIKNKYNLILVCVIFSILLVLTGGILNREVMEANDGKMPVKCCGISDEEHFNYYEDSEVNYPSLTDFIKIRSKIYSIGDLLMYLGFVMVSASFFVANIFAYKERKLAKKIKREKMRGNYYVN